MIWLFSFNRCRLRHAGYTFTILRFIFTQFAPKLTKASLVYRTETENEEQQGIARINDIPLRWQLGGHIDSVAT